MTDINFQKNNLLPRNNFLVITETTVYGQVEASQHDVSEKLVPAADNFSKLLKACAEACGR